MRICGKIDIVKIPMSVKDKMSLTKFLGLYMENVCKNMVKHRQNNIVKHLQITLSTILKKHCHTSSKNIVKHCQTLCQTSSKNIVTNPKKQLGPTTSQTWSTIIKNQHER
jgi:hypothetical protein